MAIDKSISDKSFFVTADMNFEILVTTNSIKDNLDVDNDELGSLLILAAKYNNLTLLKNIQKFNPSILHNPYFPTYKFMQLFSNTSSSPKTYRDEALRHARNAGNKEIEKYLDLQNNKQSNMNNNSFVKQKNKQ